MNEQSTTVHLEINLDELDSNTLDLLRTILVEQDFNSNEHNLRLISYLLGDPVKEVEKEIAVPYVLIKNDWDLFCEVTGYNWYTPREWSMNDSDLIYVKESHLKKLGLLKN